MINEKKILINATFAGAKPTGVGVFTTELIKNLVSINPDLFNIIALYDFLDGGKIQKIAPPYLSPEYGSIGHILRIIWSQSMLAREFKKTGSTLLFSTLPEAPVLIKNKVVVVHDIIPVKFPELKSKMKYYYEYIVPRILKSSMFLIFDSEYSRNDAFDYYDLKNIKSAVIPAGYDNNLFYPLEKGLIWKKYGIKNYFFYAGDMRPYKNLINAVKSFALANIKDTFFVIAGKKDGRFFPRLLSQARDLNIIDKVIFQDYVDQEDLPHFYRNAIALFFPSKYEGFGLPALEAMATGAPVITTRLTSLPEVCGEAALYVNPDNIEEMAAALKTLAAKDSLRESYARLSLQRASRFSWRKTGKAYMDLLTEVLNEI